MYPNVFTSQPTEEQVLGAMSLIFWTLTLIMLVSSLVRKVLGAMRLIFWTLMLIMLVRSLVKN